MKLLIESIKKSLNVPTLSFVSELLPYINVFFSEVWFPVKETSLDPTLVAYVPYFGYVNYFCVNVKTKTDCS